ncbi:unnamed protein product, partial [Polarella glacialis]
SACSLSSAGRRAGFGNDARRPLSASAVRRAPAGARAPETDMRLVGAVLLKVPSVSSGDGL